MADISLSNGLPLGIYVLKEPKDKVLNRIREVSTSFGQSFPKCQVVPKFKECCHKAIETLDVSFEDTLATRECHRFVGSLSTDDINKAYHNAYYLYNILMGLNWVTLYAIDFDKLPSCRHLLGFTDKEAAAKAVDLIDNGIVKLVSKALSIGSDIYSFTTIADIHRFYSDLIASYDGVDSANLSKMDLLFLDKARLETEYCYLATLKTTGRLTKELLDARQAIIDEYHQKIVELNNHFAAEDLL